MSKLLAIPPCPYCGKDAVLVNGTVIHPQRVEVASALYWLCTPCGAWVSTHPGSCTPIGRMANRQLREAKRALHAVFDPLWKYERVTSKSRAREEAYQWLATELGIRIQGCHIARFDLETCNRAIVICVNA